jgi:hypothetical protein
MIGSHLPTGMLGLAATMATAAVVAAAAPTVEETPGQIVVANEYYRAAISHQRGGFVSEIALADGTVVVGEHALYTDRGIYGDGVNVTSANESQPQVEVTREAAEIAVTSRGTLRGPGELAEPSQRLQYVVTYRFGESPAIGVSWSVTPTFSLEDVSGFFSYIAQVPRYAEWFAKTIDGAVFQPASGISQRCYQSALEPLDRQEPWMGLLLEDGTIVALSDLHARPGFGNVFMHESEASSTGLFCAWFSGPAPSHFVASEPWSGSFRLHIWPREQQEMLALPAFLG